MWPADDSAIDRTIDRVTEQMTTGEPSAGLRARVLERLDDRGARRRRAWMLVPMAAAFLVLVALFITREPRTGAPAPIVAQAPRTSPPVASGTAATEPRRAESIDAHAQPSESGARARPADARTVTRIARLSAAAAASEVEALAPARLAVPSIQLNEIDPAESIRLPRLETIEPIAVAPIGEPQGERP